MFPGGCVKGDDESLAASVQTPRPVHYICDHRIIPLNQTDLVSVKPSSEAWKGRGQASKNAQNNPDPAASTSALRTKRFAGC